MTDTFVISYNQTQKEVWGAASDIVEYLGASGTVLVDDDAHITETDGGWWVSAVVLVRKEDI